MSGVADAFELLALLLTRHQNNAEGARLLGAASAVRFAAGCRRLPAHEATAQEAADLARAALGEQAYGSAVAEGEALTRDAAVTYATRGRGERSRPRHGWDSLTPAEREVVAHLVRGGSNKEIAARLFVSPRTVQTHLSRVYAKVGITSRLRLAQEAVRHLG